MKSEFKDQIEYIFVELISNWKNLLIGCIHGPNNAIDINMLKNVLENVTLGYNNIIIASELKSNILLY